MYRFQWLGTLPPIKEGFGKGRVRYGAVMLFCSKRPYVSENRLSPVKSSPILHTEFSLSNLMIAVARISALVFVAS